MKLLLLFLTFFKIGAFTFGGGYAMISLVRESCLSNGWLTEGELLNLIAVSESTPGPIAINMATFVGSSQCGIIGSVFATLGVVLPSFVIILLIASLMRHLLKLEGVRAFLGGVRPAVVGMLLATALTMLLKLTLGITGLALTVSPDLGAVCIFVICILIHLLYKKLRGKELSPVILIVASGLLGVLIYGV